MNTFCRLDGKRSRGFCASTRSAEPSVSVLETKVQIKIFFVGFLGKKIRVSSLNLCQPSKLGNFKRLQNEAEESLEMFNSNCKLPKINIPSTRQVGYNENTGQ